MAITITLTDDDALDYLAHKEMADTPILDIDDGLPDTLLAAPDVQPTEPETAEEIFDHHFSPTSSHKYPKGVTRVMGPYRHHWSDEDLATIEYCSKSKNVSERAVTHLAKKLDPQITHAALSTKLSHLGIRTRKGVMYAGN